MARKKRDFDIDKPSRLVNTGSVHNLQSLTWEPLYGANIGILEGTC